MSALAAPKQSFIVVDAATGRVLDGSDSEAKRHPASLTKIMTLYMTFKSIKQGKLRMNQRLPVSALAASQPPSKLGLRRGTTIRVRDAILALITQSANDAAVVLAEGVGGTEKNFARQMTQQARQLRMTKTVFRNASGLPDDKQVTTARDMAILARALLVNFPDYYPLFRTARFTYRGVRHSNHNRLMQRYAGMDGIKTGYIRASGFNLVASAVRGKTRLIGVIFGGSSARSRDDEMAAVLDRNFARIAKRIAPQPKPAAEPLVAAADSGGNAPGMVAEGDAAGEDEASSVPMPVVAAPQFSRGGAAGTAIDAAIRNADATAFSLRRPAFAASPASVQPVAKIPGWAVQIGAYRDRADSERAVQSLGQRLPQYVRDARYEIVATRSAYATVYRVRLLGLDEKAARALCRRAAGDGRNCILIPPSA